MEYPFTADVLGLLMANYNADIWPVAIVAAILLVAALYQLFRPASYSHIFTGVVLALFWAWTGAVFYDIYLSRLFFAGPAYGNIYLICAVLLGTFIAGAQKVRFSYSGTPNEVAGLVMVALGAVIVPAFLASLAGDFGTWPLAGTEPVSTTLVTLGFLLLSKGHRAIRIALAVIPLLGLSELLTAAYILAHMG